MNENGLLAYLNAYGPTSVGNPETIRSAANLLSHGLIEVAGTSKSGHVIYQLTRNPKQTKRLQVLLSHASIPQRVKAKRLASKVIAAAGTYGTQLDEVHSEYTTPSKATPTKPARRLSKKQKRRLARTQARKIAASQTQLQTGTVDELSIYSSNPSLAYDPTKEIGF